MVMYSVFERVFANGHCTIIVSVIPTWYLFGFYLFYIFFIRNKLVVGIMLATFRTFVA